LAAEEKTMVEVLSKINGGDLATVFIVVPLMLAGLIAVLVIGIAQILRRYYERRMATTVILEMLDRGMPTEDIVRVLTAAGLEDKPERQNILLERLRQKFAARKT
jgi:hypothetical protein